MSRTEGGFDTARITAAEQDRIHREQRQADARAFLTRTGNADLLPVLGLAETPNRIPGARRNSPTKES